ncbi:uncharacterized protein LOC144625757 [Crassostrea virginica]
MDKELSICFNTSGWKQLCRINLSFQTQHEVENHRLSTVSSSYANCRGGGWNTDLHCENEIEKFEGRGLKNLSLYFKSHGRDVSCHTYVDIEDTQQEVESRRLSAVSSSYASCRLHGRGVSCHTYVDIEDVVDHRDNRDMELERCNSISTVSTLPIITLQLPDEESNVIINGGRGLRQLDDIEGVSQGSMVPRIHYEMKPPSKTKWMKKYVILFSAFIVLLFVVLLTVLAGYVDAKKIVDDTPTMAEKQVQKLPGLESLKIWLFNISENEDDFNQDILDFKNETILINKQHLKRFGNAKEELFSRTSKVASEST